MASGEISESFLSHLSDIDRKCLMELGLRRRFANDDVLLREGDPSDHIMVILSGRVRVSTSLKNGREIIYALRGQGDILGELAALQNTVRTASVRGIEVVEVLQLSRAQFLTAARERPGIALAVAKSASGRQREAEKARVGSAAMDVNKRLANYLVSLLVERGRTEAEGVVVDTPLTQDDIARQLGVSRRSVARAFNLLRKRGVVSTGRKQITIHLPDVLLSLDRP